MAPVIRGRKMVLNYTDGSPCPEPRKRADLMAGRDTREIVDGDKDDDESDRPKVPGRTKTTIISMLCDRDPLMPQLTLSFIASPDECTYFFEARSSAACAGIQQSSQTLSPSGVFGVIMMIAIIVYVVGGCVYSRVVLNQRGWRQLPNYALWAGIFGFFRVRDTSSYSCVASTVFVYANLANTFTTGHCDHSHIFVYAILAFKTRVQPCEWRYRWCWQHQVGTGQRVGESAHRRAQRGVGRRVLMRYRLLSMFDSQH